MRFDLKGIYPWALLVVAAVLGLALAASAAFPPNQNIGWGKDMPLYKYLRIISGADQTKYFELEADDTANHALLTSDLYDLVNAGWLWDRSTTTLSPHTAGDDVSARNLLGAKVFVGGAAGPLLKNDSGEIVVRNSGDTDGANVKIEKLRFDTGGLVYPSADGNFWFRNNADNDYANVIFKKMSANGAGYRIHNGLDYHTFIDYVNTKGSYFIPDTLADGDAPNNSLYYSSTQSKLVYKDGAGSVHDLY